jgi:hydroxylation protein CepL
MTGWLSGPLTGRVRAAVRAAVTAEGQRRSMTITGGTGQHGGPGDAADPVAAGQPAAGQPAASPHAADLGDPATYDAAPPFAQWDRMRGRASVCRTDSAHLGTAFWSVTGWREIRSVLGADESFVSRYGVFLGFGPQRPDPAGGRMLVVTDGAHRQALRAAMQGFFSPRRAAQYHQALVATFRSALLAALRSGTVDFAQEIAWRAPMAAAVQILGLPAQDEDRLCALANGVLAAQDAQVAAATAANRARAARTEIIAYFRQLVRARQRSPGRDLISALLDGLADGPLPPQDVVLNLLSLLVAASETSRLALTGAMVAFATHPEQWSLAREQPGLRPRAIEEVLRWTSPGLNVSRIAAGPAVLAGAVVAAGDVVTAWLPAGNRDPAVFPRPYRFDVTRPGPPHVAFGHGPHHCLGAALARVEIGALLDAAAPLVASVEIAGPLRRTHSNALTGYASAPLRLRRGPG